MQTPLFLFLLLLILAIIASKNLFVWPKDSKIIFLKLSHLLIAVVLFFFASFLTHILTIHSQELVNILVGIATALSFLVYLFFLPTSVLCLILFSGNKPMATFGRMLFSTIRMWIILIPLTELIGITLNKLFSLFLPLQELHAQAIVEQIQSNLTMRSVGLIVNLGILVPIGEEIFFRGILQTFLKGRIGRIWALVCVSIIFAISHVEYSLGSFIFVPILFVFSLLTGFLYEKERHILAPIILHALYNLTAIGLMSLG
ncbi:CPBP family intramembrane glutamic endopeptidase [Chlamydia sp. 17-3921]|uniref:CPBP family intramembrane glutamic endopeptidase n=1 Tax=Chlamydia sp. 17-3921 TaxID=2675798 RepID=UPI001919F2C7|nr:type II CAAX endopeptidase family protein [Chlamydia sp. 17-3921]